MKRANMTPKGTLIVLPGPDAVVGWRKHCRARLVEARLDLNGLRGGKLVDADLNDVAAAFAKAAARYIPETGHILFYEREPMNSADAHVQNMLGRVLFTFADCCGLELRAMSEISFESLLDRKGMTDPTPQKVQLAAERDARNGNVLTYCALKPRHKKTRDRDYADLLTVTIERRLRWPEYGGMRQAAEKLPLWLRTLDADA